MKKLILIIFLITGAFSFVQSQVWVKSFTAGVYDLNNQLLGGSEVLQLISHKKMLFASIGYWQDDARSADLEKSDIWVNIFFCGD